jgi:hypothetical protein
MGLVDTVEMIGDKITEIDMAIARLAPSDPNAAALMQLRLQLDQQQRTLVTQAFDENSAQFQSAAASLQAVNTSIGDSIQQIEHIATVIGNVTRFVTSVTNLVTTVAGLA